MYIICILIVVLAISGVLIGMYFEYKDFNNGICPKCGKQLKYFDTDSQGGRGYCCNECRYFTWVSYHWIDKKYKNKTNRRYGKNAL